MASKAWFITGCNRGFGRLMTEQLLERGERVAATTRKPNELDALKQRYPEQLFVYPLDVTDTQAIRKTVDEAVLALGTLDVVVNNAGYLLLGAAEELDDEEIDRQIATNLLGSIQVARAVLPYLRRMKRGHIIQHSSMCGQIGLPALGIYQASKWGIEGFLEALRTEVAAFNIHVTIVEPGFARTGLGSNSSVQTRVIDDYQHTSVGNFRRLLASGRFPCPGDGEKIAQAVIAAADCDSPPERLVLGSDAYRYISKALDRRLKLLEAQKDIAFSTDIGPAP